MPKEGTEIRTCKNDPAHVETRSIPKLAESLKTNQFIRIYSGKITKKSIQIRWTKLKDAAEYKVFVGVCGDAFKDTYTLDSANSLLKIKKVNGKKLKGTKCYKFFVAAYGQDANGKLKEIGRSVDIHLTSKASKYGNYSKVTLKTKKSVTLKKGQSTKVKAVQTKKRGVKVLKHRNVYYVSTNPSVAKVGKKSGKVKAVGAGSCKIYCLSQNGLYKTVKIKVK